MNSSLIDILRKRFLETIRSVNPPGKWKILVVDEHSQKLLGSVLKTYDVLEENVTLIEAVNSNRTPQPQLEAIYLLMPTSANVERIIADFSHNRTQYAGAHLFFLDGLDEKLFSHLSTSPAEPHLKQLVELFLNIPAIEARVFSLNSPEMFFGFFSPPRDSLRAQARLSRIGVDIMFTAKVLLNLCVTLNENPLIRYYQAAHHSPLGPLIDHSSTSSGSGQSSSTSGDANRRWARPVALRGESSTSMPGGDHLPKKLAFAVQAELDQYRKYNPEFPKPEPGRPRGVLIITDRTLDTVAPFLHEFTYQAMANDLLNIENGRIYHYKFQSSIGNYEDKTATLSDSDTLWTQVRHMHMREAIDKLMGDFNKFLEEHAGFKEGKGAASLNDMKDMLASLPQYQEMREKFSLHLTMAQECMDIFEKKKLPSIGNVEQNCATGVTAAGKVPKTLVEEMVPLLDDRTVSNRDKVRIIALYIMYRDGVPEEDQRRLFQHARLSLAEQDAVRNLSRLGVRLNRVPGDKDTKKSFKFKNNSTEEEYELSRYTPMLHHVLAEHIGGKLDIAAFPYVRDGPSPQGLTASSSGSLRSTSLRASPQSNGPPTSLRSAKPSWHRAPRPGGTTSGQLAVAADREPVRQRVITFVAGGLTYSEIRAAYTLAGQLNRDIYIGSTHSITPERFVDDMKVLDMEGIGSASLPNGIPSISPTNFQSYYDQRYFISDAPPPQTRSASAPATTVLAKNGNGRSQGHEVAPPLGGPSMSTMSLQTSKEKKEKDGKRKGLFRF